MKHYFYLFLSAFLLLTISSCDKCKKVTCENGGTCEEGICECPAGYGGTNCQNITDLCIANEVDCDNGGECVNGECDCERYYRGESCETYCVNGTYMKNTNSCDCYPGWGANGCSQELRLEWIGSYSVDATGCSVETYMSTIDSLDHSDPDSIDIVVNKVKIANLTTNGDTKAYGLILQNNSLTVPYQTVTSSTGDKFRVSSDTVTLQSDTFRLNVNRKHVATGGEILCKLKFTKQ